MGLASEGRSVPGRGRRGARKGRAWPLQPASPPGPRGGGPTTVRRRRPHMTAPECTDRGSTQDFPLQRQATDPRQTAVLGTLPARESQEAGGHQVAQTGSLPSDHGCTRVPRGRPERPSPSYVEGAHRHSGSRGQQGLCHSLQVGHARRWINVLPASREHTAVLHAWHTAVLHAWSCVCCCASDGHKHTARQTSPEDGSVGARSPVGAGTPAELNPKAAVCGRGPARTHRGASGGPRARAADGTFQEGEQAPQPRARAGTAATAPSGATAQERALSLAPGCVQHLSHQAAGAGVGQWPGWGGAGRRGSDPCLASRYATA